MEAEVGVIVLEDGGRGHKSRNVRGYRKLKKAKNTFSFSEVSRKNLLVLSETDFGLLTSSTVRE